VAVGPESLTLKLQHAAADPRRSTNVDLGQREPAGRQRDWDQTTFEFSLLNLHCNSTGTADANARTSRAQMLPPVLLTDDERLKQSYSRSHPVADARLARPINRGMRQRPWKLNPGPVQAQQS
jgi:hypothetical protein